MCPGSDVNSMDSVDSGCTMSASELQANSATSSNSEVIIWEIEVPKVSQSIWDSLNHTMSLLTHYQMVFNSNDLCWSMVFLISKDMVK